jgi:hypothetical protein
MNAQQPLIDRQGAITPPADADPQRRVMLYVQALGLTEAFREWLPQNWEIWFEFVRLADQMRLRGRQYYSARAVLHVLRWHRALRDPTESEFKVNNRWSAEMARLYNAMVGFAFFRTRESTQ